MILGSQMIPGTSWVTVILAVLVVWLLLATVLPPRHSNIPPGPSSYRLVGRLPDLQSDRDQHEVFSEWAKQYGSVFSVRLGFSRYVVANSSETIKQIQMNSDLSGRPSWITLNAVSAGGYNMAFQRHVSELHKAQKRLLGPTLTKSARLKTLINQEGVRLCENLRRREEMGNCFDPGCYIKLAVLNVLVKLIFNRRLTLDDSIYKAFFPVSEKVVDRFRCTENLNIFPYLRHVPGRKERAEWHKLQSDCKELWGLFRSFFEDEARRFIEQEDDSLESEEGDSLVFQFLRKHPDAKTAGVKFLDYEDVCAKKETDTSPFSGSCIQATLIDLMLAGTITTCSTLNWIILHLAWYPDLQQEIREEVERHVTDQPESSMSTDGRLGLLRGFIMEVMRMKRNVPLPHCAVIDTSLGPYRIPKGTVVLMNMEAVHKDGVLWPDPNKFDPRRFPTKGKLPQEDRFQPFSKRGERGCLGYHFADMELFLLTASLVKKFRFEVPEGSKMDLTPDPKSLVKRPKEIQLKISSVI